MSLKSKRATAKWVAKLEDERRAAESIKRRTSRIWPASKVAGGLSRRNPLADETIFKAIASSLRQEHATVLSGGRRPVVPKLVKDSHVFQSDDVHGDGSRTRTIWAPDWTHTGDRLKLFAIGSAMQGERVTLNINLAPAQIEAALRSPRGFVGYFSERMTRHLKAAGEDNPQYAFIVEGSEAHELHLHGIMVSSIPDLRRVLASVGGRMPMAAPERQVHSRSIWDLAGWANYIAKAPFTTASQLSYARRRAGLPERNDALIGANLKARARGKVWYVAARKDGKPINR